LGDCRPRGSFGKSVRITRKSISRAAYQVWAQAAAKAGTIDPQKVAATMHAGTWDTVLGPISFDIRRRFSDRLNDWAYNIIANREPLPSHVSSRQSPGNSAPQ
jgi:ABC-type branched-subunit amino acid transport system substrate-binding protein